MKNIKNLRVKSTIIPVLLAGAVSLTGCNGKVDMKSFTFDELLSYENVKDVTLLDELADDGKIRFNNKLNVLEAADMLEKYINIVKMTDSIDFSEVDDLRKLSNREYYDTLNLSEKQVKELVEQGSRKSKTLKDTEEKLDTIKKLDFLNSYCKKWINDNGKNISLSIMENAVRASVADEFDVTVDDYYLVSIPGEQSSLAEEAIPYSVIVGDNNYSLDVNYNEMWNTINYIFDIKNTDIEDQSKYDTYLKAINFAKTTIAAGSNIKNGDLEAQYDAHYIKKKYLKNNKKVSF